MVTFLTIIDISDDRYSFIRLVNFVRSCSPSSREVMELDLPVWNQDKFMLPVIEDDPLLMFDFEGEERGEEKNKIRFMEVTRSEERKESTARTKVLGDALGTDALKCGDSHAAVHFVANAEGGHVTLSQAHFDELHAALQRMQLVVDESTAALKQCREDMDCMRKVRTCQQFDKSISLSHEKYTNSCRQ